MTVSTPRGPLTGMTPADIVRTIGVSAPALSPGGARVAYVVTRVDAAADGYRSAVWTVNSDGSTAPRQLTAGNGEDQPAWSPDGRLLAFTRRRREAGGTAFELCLLPVDGGGETIVLATRDEPFEAVSWSPDGLRLVFASRVRHPRYAVGVARRA